MNKAISEIKRLPETKAQQETFVNAVIGELLEGSINPLDLELRLKIIEDTVKKIRSDIRVKNIVVEEVSKHNNLYKNGENEIQLSSRRTFDFSNDSVWVELKAKMKAREAQLKAMKCIPETGESLIEKHSDVIKTKY